MRVLQRSDTWIESGKSVMVTKAAKRARVQINAPSTKQRVLYWEPREQGWQPAGHSDEISSRVSAIVRRLPPPVQNELLAVLSSADVEVSADVWGSAPGIGDVVEAALWHSTEFGRRRDNVASASWSLTEAASATGLTEKGLVRKVRLHELSAFVTEAGALLPRWQFDAEGKPLPGVERLIRAFPGSPIALAEWVEREHPDLGQTPREVLRTGDIGAVVYAASRGSGIA